MPAGSDVYSQGYQFPYDSTAGSGVDVYVIGMCHLSHAHTQHVPYQRCLLAQILASTLPTYDFYCALVLELLTKQRAD